VRRQLERTLWATAFLAVLLAPVLLAPVLHGPRAGDGSSLLSQLSVGMGLLATSMLAGGQFGFGFGEMIYAVNMLSLRQAVTPTDLLGRMDATIRLCFRGAMPLGALFGGAVGQTLGLRTAIACGVAGLIVTAVCIAMSPLRHLAHHATQEMDSAMRDER